MKNNTMMSLLVRRVTQGATTLALAGVVILTTQWAYPAGHLVIRIGSPYYSRTVGESPLFVQIDITMKNVGADVVRVDGEHFILVDDLGNRYPRDPSTHFIQNHYNFLAMPPGYEFTATSIYTLPPERKAAWILFVTGEGRSVLFRLAPPPSAPSQPGLGAPTGGATPGPGQLAAVLAEMAARSRGIGPKDLAQADQLVDLLPHLRSACSAGMSVHGRALAEAATQCAADAESAINTIDFLRETLKTPAGRGMPEPARRDWDKVLVQATSAVRDAVVPVWDAIGREQAAGRGSATTFRALGEARDRMGRVLAKTSAPPP